MRTTLTLVTLAALLYPRSAPAQDSMAVTADELASRLKLISSDEFEGRYPGSHGETLTTTYLIKELTGFGVKPGFHDAWLQPVSITVHDVDPDAAIYAAVSGPEPRTLEFGRDIRLGNNSSSAEVSAAGELVFVGYGIYAPVYGWDDFAGTDLRGKVAVALMGEPRFENDTARFNGVRASRYSWARDKINEMERRGAVGVLWLTPMGSISSGLVTGARRLTEEANGARLKFAGVITDSTIAGLLPPKAPPLGELLASTGRPGFRSLPLGMRLSVRFRTKPRIVVSNNVVGLIPGADPTRAAEHVVLSAHWDAYGMGRPVNGDSIYNGALDDGSGVTAMLALARVFAAHPQPRSITVVFTTAEEWGLLGAEGFVRNSPVPLNRIAANLNMDDGIELYGVKRDVAPLGIELSTLGATVADEAGKKGLRVSVDPYPQEGYFLRADNFPFARAGVPSLYMALGTDAVDKPVGWVDERVQEYLDQHYHRPSDDYDTVVLDIKGAVQFAEFVRDVTISVARAKDLPRWLPGVEFSRPGSPAAGTP